MIDKFIPTAWRAETLFDEASKFAGYTPDIHVPEEISNYISALKPDPRFCYVHVIAMSDGLSYGSNLNGDIFSADQLTGIQSQIEADKNIGIQKGVRVPRYKTFEMANFYRHHANSNIDPKYGDIPCAAWNDPMRRVELIIRIYKQPIPELDGYAAPDIVAKLDCRGFLSLSMGTRIQYEQCTYCKAKNEFVHQRCTHLKNQMNQIMPNGELVAALNFGSRFFDMSDVSIPADPIAFSLQKVASYLNPEISTNRVKDVVESNSAWKLKFSAMLKNMPVPNQSAHLVEDIPVDVPACSTCEKAVPIKQSQLKLAFNTVGDLNTFVSTTALMGIVLSPEELAYVTSLSEPGKFAEESDDFVGITKLSLDNFSVPLYHSLSEIVKDRSGYLASCPLTGWEPTKIASDGFKTMADYYSFYRKLLATISTDAFTKSAHRNPYVSELIGKNSDERYARVKSAMYHLAHAGMATV